VRSACGEGGGGGGGHGDEAADDEQDGGAHEADACAVGDPCGEEEAGGDGDDAGEGEDGASDACGGGRWVHGFEGSPEGAGGSGGREPGGRGR